MIESKIFITEKVENKKRKFGSNREYIPAMLQVPCEEPTPLLLTEHDIKAAKERAA